MEEQAHNNKARDLYWKPLSWLGTIRPSSANDVFDPNLWATFVSTTLGLEVPVLSSLPRHHNNPLAKCGCKKHCMDFHGDHTSSCTAHSGATSKISRRMRPSHWKQWRIFKVQDVKRKRKASLVPTIGAGGT
jgi:hypothetical protein